MATWFYLLVCENSSRISELSDKQLIFGGEASENMSLVHLVICALCGASTILCFTQVDWKNVVSLNFGGLVCPLKQC